MTPRRFLGLLIEVVTIVAHIVHSHLGGPATRGAMVAVDDGHGNVLLVKARYRSTWSFPGGWVDRGEDFIDGATRELLEETGVTIDGPVTLIGEFRSRNHHDQLFGGRAAATVVAATTPWEIEATRWCPIDDLPR